MAGDILDTAEAGTAAIRGAALRVGGYVANVALSVVSAAVLLRYLGATRFGDYSAVFSLMSIVMGLSDAGTTQIGVREYAVRPVEERPRLLANLQSLRIVLTIVGVAGALVFCVAAGYSDAMILGAALAGVGLVLSAVSLTLLIPLQAEIRLGAVTALDLLRQTLTVVALLALVAAGGGIAGFLGVPIPVGIVVLAVTLHVVRRTVPLHLRFDSAQWRALIADTLPYAAAVAIGVLYGFVTILLMSLASTSTETGYFGAAHRIFFVVAQVPSLFVTTAFPVLARAARDDQVRLRYALQRLFEVLLLSGGLLGVLVVAGAPVAIAVVAGPGYDPSIAVLRLLGAALAATSIIAFGSFGLLALRKHAALLGCNAVGLLTTSVLTLVLAPGHGARGAAYALVIGEVVLALTLFGALVRGLGVRPSLRVVPRVAVAAALAVVPGLLLGLPAVPAAIAAGIVYLGAAFALGAVPDEILDVVRARLPGRDAGAGPGTPPPSDPS